MITRTKANSLLEQLFWKEPTTSSGSKTYYYIGLSTTTPDVNGSNFTEPVIPDGAEDDEGNAITTNEYQRVSLEGVMGSAADGIIKNSAIIFFNEAEHYGWGTITHFGIFTAKSGGTPIFWGEVPSTEVQKNYIPIFRAGKLQVGLDNDPANPT
ncbi:MAG: hypothetical protein J6C37_10720 [Roseburia sp.]|nr:hypothetical protein [Roseburia sp.]